MENNVIFSLDFTQNQLIAMGGASLGIIFVMSTFKRIIDVFYPKFSNDKRVHFFMDELPLLLGVGFMMIYQMWDYWVINFSNGILIGTFYPYIANSIKNKIIGANGNGNKTMLHSSSNGGTITTVSGSKDIVTGVGDGA